MSVMKKANVNLTINLSLSICDDLSIEQAQNAARSLIVPFLEQFKTMEFEGNKVLGFSVNANDQYSSMDLTMPNYIAQEIELRDDGQKHGGISHMGETLDDFIQELRDNFKEYGADLDDEFIYDIPLAVVNGALNECGIEMICVDEYNDAITKAAETFAKFNKPAPKIDTSKFPKC